MKTKKIPMRMCTGCGEMFDKRELVRVVKSPEGEVSLDLTGKKAGRGAYVVSKPTITDDNLSDTKDESLLGMFSRKRKHNKKEDSQED